MPDSLPRFFFFFLRGGINGRVRMTRGLAFESFVCRDSIARHASQSAKLLLFFYAKLFDEGINKLRQTGPSERRRPVVGAGGGGGGTRFAVQAPYS